MADAHAGGSHFVLLSFFSMYLLLHFEPDIYLSVDPLFSISPLKLPKTLPGPLTAFLDPVFTTPYISHKTK